MKKFFFTYCLLLAAFGSHGHAAERASSGEAYARFQEGDYFGALAASEGPIQDPKREVARLYLRANCQVRLQDFQGAEKTYGKLRKIQRQTPSIQLPKELSYEEGQAHYATKDFETARNLFLASLSAGYRAASCHYYIGFINELLDDANGAAKNYREILSLPADEEKMRQAALFRLAELSYAGAAELKPDSAKREFLSGTVLPTYQRAVDFDSASEIANGARARMDEVAAKLAELAPKMRNGVPVPAKPFSLFLAQDLGWDSNVANIADESAVNISHKATMFLKPSVLAKYQANWRDTWSFMPEAGANITFYSQRSTPQIYQNDNANLTAALRTRYEHTARQKPATALFDLEYALMLRDYKKQHQLSFYTDSYEAILGELFQLFATGPTTLKLHYQLYKSEDDNRTAIIPSVSLGQVFRISHWNWDNTLSFDYVRARSQTYDERNYRLLSGVFFPSFLGRWNFAPALTVAVKDTMRLSVTRGTEVNLNPKIDFSRGLNKRLTVHLVYGFTHYFSQDRVNYLYTEHVMTTSLHEEF